MAIDIGRVATIGKSVWRETSSDDVSGLAAELSYRFLLALFPFFIFLASLGGFVADLLSVENPSGEILKRIGDALPADAASLLETQLSAVLEQRQTGLLSIGIVTALWAAAGGMKAVMKSMNRAYDVEETRSFLVKTGLAIGLTLFASVFFIGAFILAVAGGAMASAIADATGTGAWLMALFHLGRYAAALVLLALMTGVLYWQAPAVDIPFRWISPGAIMFVIVWMLATLGFGFYVANFGSYNATYGALGGVIILLFFFYITSFILLMGAELNALLHRMALQTNEQSPTAVVSGRSSASPRAAERGPAAETGATSAAAAGGTGATNGRISAGLGAAVAAVAAWRASGRRGGGRGSMPAGT